MTCAGQSHGMPHYTALERQGGLRPQYIGAIDDSSSDCSQNFCHALTSTFHLYYLAMTDQQHYDSLEKTATDWVTSTRPKTFGSNDPDYDHIRSFLAPNAILRFGHMHFVSKAPHLQRDESPDDFVTRLKSMSPALQTWRIDIADLNVDTKKKSAVVRAVFHMQAKGDAEVIQNEILFWCQMDEDGGKILQSTEFVDPAALQALGPKLKAAKLSDGS
jgi:hypothetical protein